MLITIQPQLQFQLIEKLEFFLNWINLIPTVQTVVLFHSYKNKSCPRYQIVHRSFTLRVSWFTMHNDQIYPKFLYFIDYLSCEFLGQNIADDDSFCSWSYAENEHIMIWTLHDLRWYCSTSWKVLSFMSHCNVCLMYDVNHLPPAQLHFTKTLASG